MVEWMAHAPVLLVAGAVFLALYLAAALVLVLLWLLRRRGHGEVLGPLSPGLLSPMGLIFGLLVGFLVADVWADRGRASTAVVHEAGALRDVDMLMATFPAEQPRVRQLLREQIDTYVVEDWPAMSGRGTTIAALPAGLLEVQRIALDLLPRTDGERVAQERIVISVDRALEERRERLALSNSEINPLRLTALFLVAVTTLAATACVQIDRLRRGAVAVALLATAMALAMTLLCTQATPFAGHFAVGPDVLLQVRP